MFELIISGIILIEQVPNASGQITKVKLHVADARTCGHQVHDPYLAIPAAAIENPYALQHLFRLVPDGSGSQIALMNLAAAPGATWEIAAVGGPALEATALVGLASMKEAEPDVASKELTGILATFVVEGGEFELQRFLVDQGAKVDWTFKRPDGTTTLRKPLASVVALKFGAATRVEIARDGTTITIKKPVKFSLTNDPPAILEEEDQLHHFACAYAAYGVTGANVPIPEKPSDVPYPPTSSVSVFCPPAGHP